MPEFPTINSPNVFGTEFVVNEETSAVPENNFDPIGVINDVTP
jgi:hypothetical protein